MGSGREGRNQVEVPAALQELVKQPQWGPAARAGIRWQIDAVAIVKIRLNGVRPRGPESADYLVPEYKTCESGLNGVRPRGPESGLARKRARDLGV